MEQNKSHLVAQSKEKNLDKTRLLSMVQRDKERRDQETIFFRNESLQTYTEVGKLQFIGYREKPDWKKDYQYNVFDHITRDKVMAIISKSAGLYEAQFFNTNKKLSKVSDIISTICSAFYTDSTRRLDEKTKNKLLMLDALTTPKAIWYEGWKFQKRTIRDIEERDENGKIKKTKSKEIVHYNGPWGEAVAVEDFIPGSMRIRDIQEQPRLTWIPRMSIEEFRRKYSMYSESNKVVPSGTMFENQLGDLLVRNDLKDDEVEVAMIFEKWDDRMSIIANGILLTEVNNPMPFAHKDYPFAWAGFEELDSRFVYDMPLTIKLLDMQDMNNEILNLTLDMVWRALNEVILVKDGDEINNDLLYAGGQIPVDDPNNFNKFEFGSSFAFNSANGVLNRARQSIESASVDSVQSGQAGAGRSKTAREVLVAREAALEITTLFLQNMENMEKQKAFLRVKNQLDRYKNPVDWQKRVGMENTEEFQEVYRDFSVRNAKLSNGKTGIINLSITKAPRSKDELDKENIENDRELSQTIDVSPEFIRQIEFEVEIVANSSVKKSKIKETADARNFLSDAASMPQVLNVEYAAKEYVKSLGKKEDEALIKKATNPMEEMMRQQGQQGSEMKPNKNDALEEILNAQA